ncbi:MAG: hypothetical protein AAF989_09950 [Planctomycetota bacterium]
MKSLRHKNDSRVNAASKLAPWNPLLCGNVGSLYLMKAKKRQCVVGQVVVGHVDGKQALLGGRVCSDACFSDSDHRVTRGSNSPWRRSSPSMGYSLDMSRP